MARNKIKISVSISKETLAFIQKKIDDKVFSSVSHGIDLMCHEYVKRGEEKE